MIRIGSWPPTDLNPYLDLYYGALRPHGIVRTDVAVNDARLRADAGGLDALHFHWTVEALWNGPGPRPAWADVILARPWGIARVMDGVVRMIPTRCGP